ncbi:hypothetical protein [Croceicoccus sp. Ery15]|uniref:hypothetical protein n=1 Tax=Croceicoccus sp. Ery15 TaxID=1703338 RepID=UPI001E464F11|nr:hypothetical protein [Croceicoccus sp. Ery15]
MKGQIRPASEAKSIGVLAAGVVVTVRAKMDSEAGNGASLHQIEMAPRDRDADAIAPGVGN